MAQQQRDRAEELKDKLEDIQRDAGELTGRLSFREQQERINIGERHLAEARDQLARLRGRGYRWRPDLEEKQGKADKLLPGIRKELLGASERAARDLRPRIEELVREVREVAKRGSPLKQEPAIRALGGEKDGLDRALDEAEGKLKALVDPFKLPVEQLQAALKDLHWTLDQFEAASFKVQPEESPLAVASATWEDAPGGPQKGLMLLTDHRVRFEQKEEVTTKTTFFFFSAEKKLVQELRIDEPVGHLAASDDSTRGWVMKDQLLTFGWAAAAKCPKKTTFKVEGDAKSWDEVVESLRSGDLERHRYQGALPETDAVGIPVEWPEKCQTCGAGLTPPVKGQGVLTCGYCGQNHDVKLGTG